jgi:phosphoglycolate phosphatase-like HAD superfamily hydrolase
MKLAIFDVDGTLTNTSRVDNECFARAYADALAVTEIDTTWQSCPHVTDSGVAQHIFQQRFKREPDEAEINRLRNCFMNLLSEQLQLDQTLFAEISGAAETLRRLRQRDDWAIAIATGCWQVSANFKLTAAGIEFDQLPAGYAEDGPAREQIVQAAIERARAHYHQPEFERVVSIGDGLWDVRTARNLKLGFLGVADGERAEKLQAHGAQHIIRHFGDYDYFFSQLAAAAVPGALMTTAD